MLHLAPFEQLQLAALAGEAIREQRQQVLARSRVTEATLREQAIRRPQLLPLVDDFKKLWIADELAHLAAGTRTLAQVGLLYGWQTGREPLSRSTLSAKLKRLHKLLE